jgi:predicted PurR-regulated permease PerM
VEFIAGTLLCLVTLFFFLKDGPAMWAWFTGQFRADMQMHLRQIGLRVWVTMGAYLRGISIIGFVEASIIGIVLFVLGVPLLIPLMLLQFFAAFFPVVGAPVAGTIAVLVALVSGGLIDAIIVAIAIMVIQQMDNHFLQPVIMGRSVKLHPVVVLLALTAGGIVAGFIGALLAVPTAAIASSIGNYLNGLRSHDTPSFGELQQERP